MTACPASIAYDPQSGLVASVDHAEGGTGQVAINRVTLSNPETSTVLAVKGMPTGVSDPQAVLATQGGFEYTGVLAPSR